MAIKKSELYSSLWKSCDELRGGMDASTYKDYVLNLLFVKYVSDKYAGKKDALVVIPEGGSFNDIVALKGKETIGDGMNTIIGKLAEANGLKGVIDVTEWADDEKLGKGKDMIDRLTKLVGIFQNPALNFGQNRSDDDDILGDAYEFLMRHFATESGKSKGQFYTPAEVSRVVANVIGVEAVEDQNHTVYDPTCGSGSLLLKVVDRTKRGLTVYGQEMDLATQALCVMNMWLHGEERADIRKGNTIANPAFLDKDEYGLKRFDFVVANPPFSNKNWSNGLIDEDSKSIKDPFRRFDGFGLPPAKNGDYTFFLHIVKSLNNTGKGAVILPHGVLFRGNAEGSIRQEVIKRGLIKGIIGLPANLFYGTGIPAAIIVIDKEFSSSRKGIFMIDASKHFIKDGNKNRLRERDIHKIVDVFTKQQDVPGYARFVFNDEIEKNEYNLNIPRYVDTREAEDIQDIFAHLNGGIPKRDVDALESYWEVYPGLRQDLFQVGESEDYYSLNVVSEEVRPTIQKHPAFAQFVQQGLERFDQWSKMNLELFQGISDTTRPKDFVLLLGENIISTFQGMELVDVYAIYQILMDYWNETLKDDVYLVVENGWKAELQALMDNKGKIRKGQFDCDLLPKDLLISVEFSEEKERLATLATAMDGVLAEITELIEEHGGEEGLLSDITGDNGKLNKTLLKKFLKEDISPEELTLANQVNNLSDKEAEYKAKIKTAEQTLEKKVFARFAVLAKSSEMEVKELVVHHKWLNTLRTQTEEYFQSIGRNLTNRVQELAERYVQPLPAIESEVETLRKKVGKHLTQMGMSWR